MQLIKRILSGAILIALLSACSATPDLPAVGKPKPPDAVTNATQQPPANPSPSDMDKIEGATKTIVADYFAALVNKNFEKANSLTVEGLHVQDPADLGRTVEFQEANITMLRFDGIKTVNGKVLAFLEVHIQAKFAPNKQGAWSEGENTRFAILIRENGEWKLSVLGSSPPNLQGVTR
jgi:hypothetical protein